jgi:hypothetical protein
VGVGHGDGDQHSHHRNRPEHPAEGDRARRRETTHPERKLPDNQHDELTGDPERRGDAPGGEPPVGEHEHGCGGDDDEAADQRRDVAARDGARLEHAGHHAKYPR